MIQRYFGWTVLVFGAIGLMLLIFRTGTRAFGLFLLGQFFVIIFTFSRTQDFGIQHYYLLFPALAFGIAATVICLWSGLRSRFWQSTTIGLIFAALLVSSATALMPEAAGLSSSIYKFTPQARYYPLVRTDLGVIDRLLDRLDELPNSNQADVYLLTSSRLLNASILHVACRTSVNRRSVCDRILRTNHVDKRDGLPRQFLDAAYVVVASPIQYHLRPEDQRVIGVFARELIQGTGIGRSFQRLPDEFTLEGGVTVSILKKDRPLEQADLDAIADEFQGYYPDKRDIFSWTQPLTR
jgi:hypothetical protein